MNKKIVLTGAILLLIAIILGAFGAHKLEKLVSPESVQTFEVGVRYQFYTAFSLLILGVSADKFKFSLNLVALLLFLGMVLFSVSIYFLSLKGYFQKELKFLGPITPIGGLLMIVGWLVFILKLIRNK